MFHLFQFSENVTNVFSSSMETRPFLSGLQNTPLLNQGDKLLYYQNKNNNIGDKFIPGLQKGSLQTTTYEKSLDLDEYDKNEKRSKRDSLRSGRTTQQHKTKTHSILDQGQQFLSFLDTHLNEKTIAEPIFKEGKKLLGFFGSTKEGMTVIEPLDISKTTESLVGETKKKQQLVTLENKFNTILAKYIAVNKTMQEDIINRRNAQSSVKKFYGKSVADENENYYYVNDYGFTHKYEADSWDKRDDSCPADLEKITQPELDILQNSTNMGTGQPCSVAGKNVKNEKTGEVAWVDIKGVKHIYSEDVWRNKEKSCGSNEVDLSIPIPDFHFNAIPTGSNMTSTTVCDQLGVEPKVWKQLTKLNKQLIDIAKKIQAKSVDLTTQEADMQGEINSQQDKLRNYVTSLEKDRQNLKNNNVDLDTIDGQYDEAKIVSTQAEYEYLAWTITAAALFGIIIHQASR
jgi:hypothetical protein